MTALTPVYYETSGVNGDSHPTGSDPAPRLTTAFRKRTDR